ncbi:MAG: glucose-6-phosphate isomerase [Candidatus Sericytochromatia bacterium]|nr:glucose-6-phosphate isomerase [Candidatus Sericytochromatia bacterium]
MKPWQDPQWQAEMAVRLEFNYMLDRLVGPEHGLTLDAVKGMAGPIAEVHAQIQRRDGAGKDFLGFLDLPEQDPALLDRVVATADRLAGAGDVHVVLGIGGSYLGARAILESLYSPYRNELSRAQRGGRPRIYFEGNNLDADAMHALLDRLPGAPGDAAGDATLNVISKSGGTIETAIAFRVFRQWAERVYGKAEAARRIVATTDAEKGSLKALANQEGYETFVIPDNVGGRFSVLTPVGLLPAAIAGVDIHELVAGARAMAARCRQADLFQNPAYMYAALMDLSYRAGRNVSIMAAWTKRLEFVGFWYDQLGAESLGKQGGGRIPFTSVNSRDLHARGQQVQEGPHNTVVTNLVVGRSARPLAVEPDAGDLDGLNYLAGWDLDRMQRGAMEGTRFAYAKDGRPSLNVELPAINAFTLGQLFYMFEVATLAEGYLQRINPLDQPGVEAYKKFMFGNLGRSDMAAYKAEFDARPQGLPELVI